MSTIKAGIIGCGGIANEKHLPALKKINEIELVAFCDLKLEKAQKAADEYGIPESKVYTDYKELLALKEIDAVYVLTPNKEHSIISIDALNAGKHVMCEKPMAKTYAEAVAMCEAAKKNNKVLTIGYQVRRSPENMYINKLCKNNELGEIYYAKAIALRRRGVPTWGVFLNEDEQGGGPLIDIGTHALDMVLWNMNNYEPKMVVGRAFRKLADQHETANAWGDWDPEKYKVEDSAFGFIIMKNGATISLESSWALNISKSCETSFVLCGTEGGAELISGKVQINKIKYNTQVIENPSFDNNGVAFYEGVSSDPVDIEAKMFIDSILNGTKPSTLPEQAAVVTQILEAIYESSNTGKPIYFD